MKFSIHTTNGTTVALVDHIEEALAVLKMTAAADSILRVSDGALLATKRWFKKAPPVPAGVVS